MMLRVPLGDSPQATFKFIEQGIFGISDEDWPTALLKRINQLTNDYTNDKHRLHVLALNQGFDLFPAIDVTSFNADIVLINLFRTVVEPRLRHVFQGFAEMEVDVEAMELPLEEVERFVVRMETDRG